MSGRRRLGYNLELVQITVRFFAILRDRAGLDQTVLQLPEGATVRTAARTLSERLPAISRDLERTAFAVNREYADQQQVLHDGDELALIPPVSGGCP